MRNNCENRENSFRQFLYEGRDLLSVRLLLAVNEGGEGGGKKKKKKKERATQGGRRVWGKARPTESTKFGRCGARKPRKRRHLIGEAYAELSFNQRENINP